MEDTTDSKLVFATHTIGELEEISFSIYDNRVTVEIFNLEYRTASVATLSLDNLEKVVRYLKTEAGLYGTSN